MSLGPRLRSVPVGYKIILPFALFSLLVGVLVSAVTSGQLAASAAAQLDALSIREEDSVNATFDSFQQRQLADLRFITGTEGVTSAIQARDTRRLRDLLFPIIANQYPDRLRASIVTGQGSELIRLAVAPGDLTSCQCSGGRDLSAWPHVMEVLQGRSDVLGPKFAGIAPDDAGALFFTVGPITSSGQVIGAAVVGEPVADLLSQLSAGHQSIPLALYRIDGSLVGSTQGFPQQQGTIGTAERLWVIGRTGVVHHQADASGLSQIFFVPWDIRGEPFGYAAVVLPSSTVASAASNEARVLMLIFLCSLAVTVLGGLFVSRSITRPLSGLLQATRQVGAGNLHHRAPVGSTDEIGQLAESFNTMTAMLQERTQRLEFSSEATVQTLAAAIDARDPYTHGHSLRVAAYSEALGVAAGLDEEQMENVRRGCLVHDVGKIGVPDSILSKPGRLEAHEEREMREHPVVGYEMLRRLPWSHEAMEIVRNHHERWDGRGYPDRLRGERIPALARLVAVADSLDAMTSHRPYRRALSFSEAAMEIENGAGAQFDPQVVAAFRAVREELRRLKNTLSEEDAESTRLAG